MGSIVPDCDGTDGIDFSEAASCILDEDLRATSMQNAEANAHARVHARLPADNFIVCDERLNGGKGGL